MNAKFQLVLHTEKYKGSPNAKFYKELAKSMNLEKEKRCIRAVFGLQKYFLKINC